MGISKFGIFLFCFTLGEDFWVRIFFRPPVWVEILENADIMGGSINNHVGWHFNCPRIDFGAILGIIYRSNLLYIPVLQKIISLSHQCCRQAWIQHEIFGGVRRGKFNVARSAAVTTKEWKFCAPESFFATNV